MYDWLWKNSRKKLPESNGAWVWEAQLPCYFTITPCLVSAKSHQPAIDQESRFRGEPDISSLGDLLLLHSAFLKRSYFLLLQQHKVHFALHNFFCYHISLVRLFFRMKRKKKKKREGKSSWTMVLGLACVRQYIIVDFDVPSLTWFVFYLLMINEYIMFPSHTIPETQQGKSFIWSKRKVILFSPLLLH